MSPRGWGIFALAASALWAYGLYGIRAAGAGGEAEGMAMLVFSSATGLLWMGCQAAWPSGGDRLGAEDVLLDRERPAGKAPSRAASFALFALSGALFEAPLAILRALG